MLAQNDLRLLLEEKKHTERRARRAAANGNPTAQMLADRCAAHIELLEFILTTDSIPPTTLLKS